MRWGEVRWREVKWSEGKWRELRWSEGKWNEVKGSEGNWGEVKCGEVSWREVRWSEVMVRWGEGKWNEAMGIEVKWSEVMIFVGMCVWSLIYSYVAVCMLCAVRCVIIVWFYLLLYIYSTDIFNIICMFVSCFVCLFSIMCILCFCTISPVVYSCPLLIFVQVYPPLPRYGNQITVNVYHTTKTWYYNPQENLVSRQPRKTTSSCPFRCEYFSLICRGLFSSFRILSHLKCLRGCAELVAETFLMISLLIQIL